MSESKNPNHQTSPSSSMADVKSIEGAEFPEKRKLDLPNSLTKSLEEDKGNDDSNKRQKLEIPSGENGSLSHPAAENVAKSDEHPNVKADAEDEDDEDDEEDYNAEQDEDDDASGEAEIVDTKGKGIMRDDKGKGKMIEDSEDDDDSDGHHGNDDDSSDDSDSDFSDGLDESDLEDDPLAEVDLDNILPSRTRQRQVKRGVVIKDSDKGKDA